MAWSWASDDGFDDVLVEPFMPDGAVVALDVGVLLRLAGLDVLDGDAPARSPDQQLATDVIRAVVDPCGAGLAAPLDVGGGSENGLGDRFPDEWVKASDHALGGQVKVHFDPQPFAIEVVEHVQQPKRPSFTEAIRHEVHRPGHARGLRHRQRVGFVPLQPLVGLDPQVQLQLAVDAIDALVVPRMPHVAQVQETQAKPPSLPGIGQPNQQIGDLFVLGL